MVLVLDRADVQRLVAMADVIAAVREAFAAADRGQAVTPAPLSLRLPDSDGELHVKGAYLTGAPVFAVKTATGFYRNPSLGLPVSDGMTLVYDAATGQLTTLIADGGLLTDLRTAAAGAVAADLLARPAARTAAVIGTGGQARHQLRALLAVRPIEQLTVWGRREEAARRCQQDLSAAGLTVSVAATARAAVTGADVVITATSATGPLVEAGWLAAGTHLTAVGSDMPHKQELDPRVLAAADKYVPDSIQAAAESGELHHAIAAGVFDPGRVHGELGALASGRLPGRAGPDELTVADLTGLGFQDAAVAALTARLATEHGAGRDLPLAGW
ncbi:MAG: ornithine cyclodeaminase family protein [Actinobacteria bacterium]|nr:ornithine cyclodeaminase family protein [Actinomycetota bacterium]